MNKFHAKKTEIDGIIFDSKHEAERYAELKLLERGRVITDLTLQPRFELQEGYTSPSGKRVRPITYIADFMYTEDGKTVVEDAKGMKTDVYRLKKKIFEYKYGIEVREV